MSGRLERRLLFMLLILAAVIRVAFYLELKNTDLAAVPLLDSEIYHDWAADLVAGDWGWHQTYWMGPLYPHLLAIVYWCFGVGSQAALVLQLALSWLNILLLYRLARTMLGADPALRGVPLLASALFAFYGAPVFYAGNLLMATLVTTLMLVVARQAWRAAIAPSGRAWFGLGLSIGLAGLARGNVLLLAPLMPWLLWRATTPAWRGIRPRLRLFAALGLGVVICLAPVTLRNLIVADDFVILTSNGGVNLLIGQQANYKGLFAPVMDEEQGEFDASMERPLERELGRDLKGSEVSRILTRRAWDTFRANLAVIPEHYAYKIFRFWNGYELPQIVSYDYYHREFVSLRMLPVPYFIISALGLAGLWLLPAGPRRLLLILVGGYFLSLLPFFPTSRYRQPIAPLLAIAAATWLVVLWRQPRRRRIWLPAGLVLLVICWPRWAALDPSNVEWQVQLNRASRAARLNKPAKTLAAGRLAEAARPGLADTPFHVASYLEDLGDEEAAIEQLKSAAERAPDNRLIPYRIGRDYEKLGRARQAVAFYEKAAALDPSWSHPWLRGGLVLRAEGRLDEALRAMQRAYELAPGNRRIRANLASLYAQTGDLAKAHRLLVSLTDDYPYYVNGWFNRALVEYQAGRLVEARHSLASARDLHGLSDSERKQIESLARAMESPARP